MTSSWHSISGYMHYKPGGALGRLKVRRRYWFLLDDSRCHLLCYRNQKEASRIKQPISKLDLQSATFTLSLSDANQFTITCGGKEHIYTAENHESMMIWLIGLQATRDAYVTQNTAKLEKALSSEEKSPRDIEFKDGRLHLMTSSGAQQQRRRRLQQKLSESNDGTADLFPISQCLVNADAQGLSRSLDGLKSSSHYQVTCQSESQLTDSTDQAASEEVFHDDLQPSPTNRWRHIRKAVSDITDSKVAALYMPKERNGSLSGTSASSDSALDRSMEGDLCGRVTDMEQELITVKCELAEMKNRETCYKAVLERRDAIIVAMDEQLDELRNARWDKKTADRKLRDQLRILQNQNHFLNEEIRKLGSLRQQEQVSQHALYSQLETLQVDVTTWRHDYLYLLQSSVRVPTGDLADGLDIRLYGGNRHRDRIQALLEEARRINPSLPTFDKLACSRIHVDSYGFKHQYQSEGMLMHYLCQQLHLFYLTQSASHRTHQAQWREVLAKARNAVIFTKELKVLVRRGIPPQYRRDMWRHLVYHHVNDVMVEKGACYYSNLCRNAHDSEVAAHYRKQISLDLLRTMPSNVNFCHAHAPMTQKLQEVLLAFCLHNPAVGYCQGMNFITAMGLLFMDPEDAFWLLVAVTEKYFAPSYFDAHLSGAQADQQVLKDIMKVKLSDLHAYMDDLDIDISTVTLNWFLAIFFDAVPFETLLRMWDCFLLEGPKVLLRFALAILKLNEATLAERSDTISVMRHLKASAGLLFDVDGLVKVAFEDLKPFPRRCDIIEKQATYLTSLKERLKKKAQQRRVFDEKEQLFRSMGEAEDQSDVQVFECAATCDRGLVWLCYGDQQLGRMSLVDGEEALMFDLDLELDSRITCMSVLGSLLILGTLSGQLTAYDTHHRDRKWTVGVHDTVLALCCHLESNGENKVFAALADGTVAVLENVDETAPSDDPFYIPVGRGPVTSLAVIGCQLWCACANRIYILHAETLDTMDRFLVSQNPLEHILTVQSWVQGRRTRGLWVAIKGSSVIELWDHRDLTCKMLFDVRQNKHIAVRKEDDGPLNSHRITTIQPVGDSLWVGTGEGALFIYDIIIQQAVNQSDKGTSDSPHISKKSNQNGHAHTLSKSKTLDCIKTRSRKGKDKGTEKDSSHRKSDSQESVLQKNRERKAAKGRTERRKQRLDISESEQERLRLDRTKKMRSSKRRCTSQSTQLVTDPDAPDGVNSSRRSSNTHELETETRQGNSGGSTTDITRTIIESSNADLTPGGCTEKKNSEITYSRLYDGFDEEFELLQPTLVGEERLPSSKTVTKLTAKESSNGKISEDNHTSTLKGSGDGSAEGKRQRLHNSDVICTKNGQQLNIHNTSECRDSEFSENITKESNKVSGESEEKTSSKTILDEMLKKVQERRALPPVETSVLGEISILGPETSEDDHQDESDGEEKHMKPPMLLNLEAVDGNLLKAHGLSPITEGSESTLSERSNSYQSLNSPVPSSIQQKTDHLGHTGSNLANDTQGKVAKVSCLVTETVVESIPNHSEVSEEKNRFSETKNCQQTSECDLKDSCHSITRLQDTEENKDEYPQRSTRKVTIDSDGEMDRFDEPQAAGQLWTCEFEDPGQGGFDDPLRFSRLHSSRRKKSFPGHENDFPDDDVTFQLSLDAKIKISDKAIRCLHLTRTIEEPIIISCSGCHGDDESVLKWRKEPDEKLWTNEPVFEVYPETNRPRTPVYLRKFSAQASSESLRHVTHVIRKVRSRSGP